MEPTREMFDEAIKIITTGHPTDTTPTLIARTIAAERERCAKIAENWHPMLYAPEMGGSHPRDSAYRDAKAEIAKAIRR